MSPQRIKQRSSRTQQVRRSKGATVAADKLKKSESAALLLPLKTFSTSFFFCMSVKGLVYCLDQRFDHFVL